MNDQTRPKHPFKPCAAHTIGTFQSYWSAPVDPTGSPVPGEGYGLGNVPSPALRATWEAMLEAYNGTLERHSPGFNRLGNLSQRSVEIAQRKWTCLGPATGTGKSEFAYWYLGTLCALPENDHYSPGAVLLSRSIDQCDDAVSKINKRCAELTGSDIAHAVAFHSQSPTWDHPELITPYRVVVMTHEGFKGQYRRLADGQVVDDKLELLATWKGALRTHKRGLSIIDENLTSVCDNFDVKLLDLKGVYKFITPEMKENENITPALDMVEAAALAMDKLAKLHRDKREGKNQERDGYLYASEHIARLVEYDPFTPWLHNLAEALRVEYLSERKGLGKRTAAELLATLTAIKNLDHVLRLDNYFHKIGKHHTISAGRYILPPNLNGPCLLDATVNHNALVELLGEERAVKIPMRQDTRSYANVTLHRVRVPGTGLSSMGQNSKDKSHRLLDWLSANLRDGDKCLVVSHMEVEQEHLAKYLRDRAHEFSKIGATVSLGHWFALDGRNDWNDHNKVVLFGLPHRPRNHTVNLLLAMREYDDGQAYLDSSEVQQLRHSIENKTMIADVIQAINRVRCRRTVDEFGNCLPVDVFILLQDGTPGDTMEDAITREMPNIKLADWDHRLEAEAKKPLSNVAPDDRAFISEVKRASKTGGTWELEDLLSVAGLPSSREYQDALLKKASNPKTYVAKGLIRHAAQIDRRGKGETLKRYVCFR
ncbi:MAG: hypothetical protein AB7U75_19920 [Hyphomicrobiaceae bacterium]